MRGRAPDFGNDRKAWALFDPPSPLSLMGKRLREKPRGRAGSPTGNDEQQRVTTRKNQKAAPTRAALCRARSKHEREDAPRSLAPPPSATLATPPSMALAGASLKATRCAGGHRPALTEAPASAHAKACRLQGECRSPCLTRGKACAADRFVRPSSDRTATVRRSACDWIRCGR